MKAVSVAEPSVWNQLMSPGTLRKRKYRIPPTSPDRSSSQSIGYRIRSRVGGRRRRHQLRSLNCSGAGSDRARTGARRRARRGTRGSTCRSAPSRRCPRPPRPRTGCRARGGGARPRTGSGRARGRAGRRCGCPRCRTGRRGRGSRSSTAASSSSVTSPTFLRALAGVGPFGCTGQPRCTQWLERIVKLGSSFFVSGCVTTPL